ncbi:histidine kinase [Acrocarpospora phusangensis]|uniref:Histidine kinase n=1 Tax=Acrocarpospora phusangensis TaxID=1070424 RepID=A0A919QGP9_9ACTN|nr:sensor histidine kinase [Acrocarpospora phusangensis]GIH27090.1 histidine kinase [Acrocarpospora phusangensis]
MGDKGIARARRLVLVMLNMTLATAWFIVLVASAAGFGPTSGVRLGLAMLGLLVFSWLFLRVTRAILQHRYATREVVITGVLAYAVAVAGGANPTGWGFVPFAWLAVAAIGLSRRNAVLLGAATIAVSSPLAILLTLFQQDPVWSQDEGSVAGLIVGVLVYNLLIGTFFPWANRLWVWIWQLAEQAHDGREAQARLAVAEERLRFARDLHDLVGHQLSAIAVKSELAVRLADDPARAAAEMAEVRQLARKALRELREAVRGYRELDLVAELGSVRAVLEAAGVECRLHLPYRDVPAEVAPVFAWVVREAVTNVLRHSTASFCDITVRFTGEEAVLEVRNDGVTARPVAEDVGSGLTGLGERLAAVGGTLSARPNSSGEFTLRAVAPVLAGVAA